MTDYSRRQINLLLDMKERTESVQEKNALIRAVGLFSMQEISQATARTAENRSGSARGTVLAADGGSRKLMTRSFEDIGNS